MAVTVIVFRVNMVKVVRLCRCLVHDVSQNNTPYSYANKSMSCYINEVAEKECTHMIAKIEMTKKG